MGFISVLIIIVAVLLVIVVLIQNSKGGGIASNFASSTQVVGVKRQAEIIEKITWGLATALIVLSLASAAFSGTSADTRKAGADNNDAVVKNANLPPPPNPSNNTAPFNGSSTGGTGSQKP